MVAAPLNRPDRLPLIFPQTSVPLQDLRVTQHCVQGGADLMAHIRKESALGLVGGLRRLFGFRQRLIGLLQSLVRLPVLLEHLVSEALGLSPIKKIAPAGKSGEEQQGENTAA